MLLRGAWDMGVPAEGMFEREQNGLFGPNLRGF
jgi:hypothetical protein